MMGRQVSIIIPHRNQFDELSACLDRLMELGYKSQQILVVDNGSDGSLKFLEDYPVGILYSGNQPSPYIARNMGIKHAYEGVIVLLDVNAIVEPGWLEAALEILKKDNIVGGIPSRPDSENLDIWQRFDYLYSVIDPSETKVIPVKALPATNLFFYKKVWQDIGPFPNVRSLGDMAWTTRARKSGYKLIVDSRVRFKYPFKSRKKFTTKFRRLGGGKIENHSVRYPFWYILKNFLPPSPAFVKRMYRKNRREKMRLSIIQIIVLCYWVKINYGLGAMRQLYP